MKKSAQKSFKNQVRAHVYYSGRVQGVGFRYTAEGLALKLRLTGWVKNLPDGRVEMICEGPKETIETLFEQIKSSMLGKHIRKTTCDWSTSQNAFKDFQVEFHL